MNVFFNSIGKKISIIILMSLIVITLMVSISIVFFGRIGNISGITKQAYEYELLTKNASIGFDEFVLTGEEAHYDKLVKTLQLLILTDGRMRGFYLLLKEGRSVKEAYKIYKEKSGDTFVKISAVNLVNSLMGTPLVIKMDDATALMNNISTKWFKTGNTIP